jgi:transcriptional regulator with XRE-family HTH domain
VNVLSRIDKALLRAGKSRQELADFMGISVSTFSKLARRPGSSMKPENLAQVARFTGADLYWLCTGEGGVYVAADSPLGGLTALALQCARELDSMAVDTRAYAAVALSLIAKGERGDFPSLPAPRPP